MNNDSDIIPILLRYHNVEPDVRWDLTNLSYVLVSDLDTGMIHQAVWYRDKDLKPGTIIIAKEVAVEKPIMSTGDDIEYLMIQNPKTATPMDILRHRRVLNK